MAASVAQENPPFPAPEDQEQKNIIDKLANFVARNGSKFEEMTKEKQKENKKFGFLFGGEYYNYYKWRVSVEIAQSQTQQHKQNALQYQQKQVQPALTPQYGTNPQAAIIQQAIVQQSINSAPWQQAQQQAQQQMQTLHVQQQQPPVSYMHGASQVQPQPPDLNLPDFETLLQKIMESCTKDSISVGKGWIINNNKSSQHCYHIAQYLLRRALTPGMQFQHKLHIIYLVNDLIHHCARKPAQDLQKAIQDVVVPIFVHTLLGETPENQQKLTKVLNIWESNNLFEGSYMLQMKNPESSQGAVQAALQQHGFTSQYNYQQPTPVSGADPHQYQPYQQYQQYYQQYPVYQQPPPQYQQPAVDTQTAGQYQQPPTETQAQPQGQYQHPPPETHPQPAKQEKKEQQDETKGQEPKENTQESQDTGEESKEMSSKENDSQSQQEEMQNRDVEMMGPREDVQHDPYQSEPYQEYHYEEHPPYRGPPPPFRDYSHFPPPFPPPNFSHPPPNYNQMPPGYPDGGYGFRGPPPPFARPRGPHEEFEYRHQRPGFGDRGPPVVNDYNHGMAEEGYEEEYEEPPPPPEPIIPNAMYYELPAGLMAPLVKISDVDYKPIDPADLRLPAPQPPSERLLAAVEAFYSPPSHDSPRNSEGWEQSGLFEFYKAKLPYIKERDARAKQNPPEEPSLGRSRSRSKSRSPVRSPRARSRSLSPRRRRSRSLSPSHRRRSRSRSISPPRRRRSKSRSRSISPFFTRTAVQRSPSPPSYMPSFMAKTMDTRIEESNVGHMLLKKMGWEGAGLGKSEQGIQNPIEAGEVRDKFSKYKGVGVALKGDAFEEYRKNRSYTYNRPRSERSEGSKPPVTDDD